MGIIIGSVVAALLTMLTWTVCFFAGLSSRWRYPNLRYAVLAPMAGGITSLAILILGDETGSAAPLAGLMVYTLMGIKGFSDRVDVHAKIQLEIEQRLASSQAEAERQAREEQEALEAYFDRFNALEEIMEMHPADFEAFVAELFRKLGYTTTTTSYVGDEGIDLFLKKDGREAVVQCKRHSGTVGQGVVRDMYGAMIHCKAHEAFIVTTGRFTLPAIQWAQGKPIRLVDGVELVEWIRAGDQDEGTSGGAVARPS